MARLTLADLPHALACQADLAHDVDLPPALLAGFADRVGEMGGRDEQAVFVLPVLAGDPPQRLGVHDLTIAWANPLDKRTEAMPRWLA